MVTEHLYFVVLAKIYHPKQFVYTNDILILSFFMLIFSSLWVRHYPLLPKTPLSIIPCDPIYSLANVHSLNLPLPGLSS